MGASSACGQRKEWETKDEKDRAERGREESRGRGAEEGE